MPTAINLVPETQQVQQQDDRKKKLAFSLIVLVNGGLIALVVILFLVTQGQRFAISRLTSDIQSKHQQFVATENVQQMTTLQQNLKSLKGLYPTRAVYTKFLGVFEKVAPSSISITSLSSLQDGQLTATGNAPNYRLVTKLVEAMKANGSFENIEIKSASGEGDTIIFNISATVLPEATAVGGQK